MLHLVPLLLALAADPGPSSAAGELLLADGDAPAAAGLFETTWNTNHDPAALVRAGEARARDGHHAHAVAYLTQALTLDLTPALAQTARDTLAASRRHTTLVSVELDLAGPGAATLSATRVGSPAPALYFALAPTAGAQVVPLELDAGRWRLELRQGDRRTVQLLAVRPDVPTHLRPPSPSSPVDRPPRIYRLTGSLLGSAVAIAGISMLIPLQLSFRNAAADREAACPWTDRDTCDHASRWIAHAINLRAASLGMLGGGLGFITGSVTASLPRVRQRRIAWAIELGLGGLLTATSAIGGPNKAAVNVALHDELSIQEFGAPAARHSAGATLLGLGLGLATSATIGLILDAATTRNPSRLRAGITPTGLALSGSF